MTAVVRPRRHLVHEEPASAGDKQLHAQHADVVQLLCHAHGQLAGLAGQPLGNAGRHRRRLQDAVAMMILSGLERHDPAVHPAREHDRQLELQVEALLQDACDAAQAAKGIEQPPWR